ARRAQRFCARSRFLSVLTMNRNSSHSLIIWSLDMTPAPDDRPTAAQPPLADLMARYLGRQTAAHVAGLAAVEPGEVEPYEAVPVQAVDPWDAGDGADAAQ